MGKGVKIIILAGGRGERLRPITNTIPKPMVEISGRPLLEHIIEHFKKNDLHDIILTVSYLAEVIQNYFGNGKKFGIRISYSKEKKLLGTAGSIGKLRRIIHNTFIVASGDIIRYLNITDVLKFHKEKKGIATICIYKNFSVNPKSIIKINKVGKIISFIERPKDGKKDSVWSNASFYIFEPRIFDYIFENQPSDFGKDIFPALISSNQTIYGYIHEGYFQDIGTITKLQKVRKDVAEHKVL